MESEIINGQGSIQNVLKRIGESGSNMFCVGHDPLLQSGVIVSQGKIVSSKILDIRLKSSNLLDLYDYANKIEVSYVDTNTKHVSTLTFNILNDKALQDLISILKKNQEVNETIAKIQEKQAKYDEKLQFYSDFLIKYGEQVPCIPEMKHDIIALQMQIDNLTSIIHSKFPHEI